MKSEQELNREVSWLRREIQATLNQREEAPVPNRLLSRAIALKMQLDREIKNLRLIEDSRKRREYPFHKKVKPRLPTLEEKINSK